MIAQDLGVAAGALQLVVPSYGLRLVRRFGAHRVGWFLVIAFCSLAALHLLEPMRPTGCGIAPELMINIVYAVGSVLLLIGMSHIDTLFSQTDRSRSNEEILSSRWQAQVHNETAFLTRTNDSLQQEIAHRKHAEAAIRESEAQYRFAFTENPRPMWVLDLRECRFLAVNKAALHQYGFTAEEFMRLTPQDLLPPEQVPAFMEEMTTSHARAESKGRWNHYRKNQTLFEVELAMRDFTYAGAPARLVVVDDISEQLRREDEAYQASKMDLASRITSGVARQFGSVLVSIENHTDLLRRKPHDAATGEQLQEITLALTRGTNLIYQMLAASGQQPMQPRPLDINRLISNLTLILRRIIGEGVNFQNLCGPNPLAVTADPQVLEHIIINLLKNAREAMPDKGAVTVRTAVVRVEPPPVPRLPGAVGSEFVRLSVRDTGCGMSPEVQTHLFEPFFTSKDPENGVGLGLASIYGSVRQLGGWVECITSAGSGTEFRIYLPCVSESLLPSASEVQTAAALERGTVLLVDSNDRTRGVARYILSRHGYRVVEADSGEIAQTLWESQARSINLLLTDMTLPGASGFDLANKLQQKRPELKVIYVYAGEESQIPILPDGCTAVTKPYHSQKLITAVEACLPESS